LGDQVTTNSIENKSALTRLKDFPRGFWFVFWGELSERASYYGMRTLLALFLFEVLHFDRSKSAQTVQFFMASCYFMPLVGGYIADHFLGKFKTIIYFSFPYILGHFVLGSSRDPITLYIALGLLAVGVGSVKPNVTPLMGMIFEKAGKSYALSEAFSYFYAAINIGAFVTSAALPHIRDHYGYTVALIVPAFAMTLSTGLFAMGKKYYPQEELKSRAPKSAAQKREERETLLRISGVFTLIVGFWIVYDQSASTWVFFAKDHMDLRLWPFNIVLTPDEVQAYNPLFILALTPGFIWLWNFLKKRNGVAVPATKKIIVGFAITFICMSAMALAGLLSQSGKVSVWWEVIATFVITVGELCVSVVGLELAYSVASPRTKSTVTAAFLLTIFAGDFIGGIFASYYERLNPAVYFGMQAVILAFCTVAFYFVGKKFDRMQSLEAAA
jgi:POT family proton-dependent oligopeptide transporter